MEERRNGDLAFPIAPMSLSIRVLTIGVLILPLLFAALSFSFWPMVLVVPALLALYGWVWLSMRPSRFVIAPDALRIEWPMRKRGFALRTVESAAVYSSEEFQREYRFGFRWGVGGLWGGFGLLLTKKGWLSMYISRTSDFVVVKFCDQRPLLITPERPGEFVAALTQAVSSIEQRDLSTPF